MTKFALIYPFNQTVHRADCRSELEAMRLAGLNPGHVDFAEVAPGVTIIVFEFSLFVPPEKQAYFAIGRQLFGGNAVLFAHTPPSLGGVTIDLDNPPLPQWMQSAAVVERNIELDLLDRPEVSVNGVVTWRWPEERKS